MDHATFADRTAHGVVDVRRGDDALEALSAGEGFWAVVATFEGAVTAVRFAHVEPRMPGGPAGALGEVSTPVTPPPAWRPLDGDWHTSLDRDAYVAAVQEVRSRIAAGTVYQVNVCRVVSHRLDDGADLDGLDSLLRQGNPAPHAARIRCAEAGLDVVCASPELYLGVRDGRVVSRPIKGTAPTAEQLLPKDHAENVMIVDLVRNDLSPVSRPGTVSVDELCVVETHPGLVHLVSTVSGRLRAGTTWRDVLAAAYPPGSVSGAPKSSALQAIADLEPVPRGPYCGAVGWVDAGADAAELAVGIRTFWAERDAGGGRWLRFGTGAGITWHSDPVGEWRETELKAARLVGLAAGAVSP
ncbi:para-aminobenzoate synthetase component 1 [Terracoccus luteus]|uniref:Para-aminobenzoate synthetase component 1 n=1 Tax=Terracoccus luteus TaxID=53356 RepID=A0A495XZH4_9MICO|nr:chorismate-binding protein [Terracoccus luteus]RKT77903.1 para-aminobenzoate synthetase component 1 [Terracoccus luteus]